ncbi:hypothetical protein LINPERPRIM_LOCUS17653 [Linum perenne]
MGSKSKSPVFPMPEDEDLHHFTDYGFDPQFHYSQFLEEAKKHKKSTDTSAATANLHLKLKPISKDESKVKKQRWWNNALLFFNLKLKKKSGRGRDKEARQFRPVKAMAMSGPVYITESRSGSSTPYRNTTSRRRPYSGPLAGTLTPAFKGEVDLPYVCLKELNMDQLQMEEQRVSTSALPIYLVT